MSVRARVSSGDPVTSDISRSPQALCPPTNSQVTALHHDLAAPLPWKGLDDVELATLEYVDWFNHRRLHGACGDIPPVEFEDLYYRSIAGLTEDQPAAPSLH